MIFLTFEEDLKVSGMQVFYFYAPWMPWHKKMLIMIEKAEKKHTVPFLAIDTDAFKSSVRRFGINQVPTMLILENGQELGRLEGLPLTSAFNNFLNTSLYVSPKG
jgi:thioredoxin-like negative regulator of GroEL